MVGDGRAEKPIGDSEAAQRQVIAEGWPNPRSEGQKAEVVLPAKEQGHLVE